MSDQHKRPSRGRSAAIMAAKLAVSLILLAILFSRVDLARLWASARRASLPWLVIAMVFYTMNMVLSTWRWSLLLGAQHVQLPGRRLLGSLLVANFFNNFLPSNIGGDVIRIRDTAHAAHSKTVATTVVLVDRALGLLALVLIAAVGASMAVRMHGDGSLPVWPSWLWAAFVAGALITAPAMYSPAGVGRILQPLTAIHPEWIGGRIDTMTAVLNRFREQPLAVVGCFSGALIVQGLVVAFYFGIVHSLGIPITWWDLAVIVPLSLVVQMLPLSLNGFGVREAAFSVYFSKIGLPIESGVLLSLVGAALMMLFSLSGAAVYVSRHHH